jgi:phosphatidylglycerophosphatase A
VFDIVKPWPIGLADRKIKGGFGVMFDDLLAALLTIVFILTLRALTINPAT